MEYSVVTVFILFLKLDTLSKFIKDVDVNVTVVVRKNIGEA